MASLKGPIEHDTPKRAKVRGVCQFLESHNLLGRKKGQVTKQQVFEYFGVSRNQGGLIIQCRIDDDALKPLLKPKFDLSRCSDPDSRRLSHDPRFAQPRHRPSKFTLEDAKQVDRYLENLNETDPDIMYETTRQSWQEIVSDAGFDIDVVEKTIAQKMRLLGWHSCLEEVKLGNAESTRQERKKRADREVALKLWDNPVWRGRVYCADQWHFSFQREGRRRLKRKPSHKRAIWTIKEQPPRKCLKTAFERYYRFPIFIVPGPHKKRKLKNGRIFHKKNPWEQTALHCVAVVGPGYKSPLYWYEVQTNDNGKIDVDTYKLVYKRVYEDIEKHHGSRDFIMWEDGDGTHSSAGVKAFRKAEGVKSILNPHHCPETNPIEDVCIASVVKSYVRRHGHGSIGDLQQLAVEGFKSVNTTAIDRVYADMHSRWLQLQAAGGRRINR